MEWPPKLPRGCPLTVNKGGYVAWINGKTRWICGKKSVAEAVKLYHRKAAAFTGGDVPLVESAKLPAGARPTLHYILARWLKDRRGDAERGKLKAATYLQYQRSGKRIDDLVGHWVADEWSPSQTEGLFVQLEKKYGNDFARRAITHFRTACKHAAERDWCRSVRYGESIVSGLTARPAAQMKWKLYDRAAIRTILATQMRVIRNAGVKVRVRDAAEQLLAMILLALNGGMGAQECSDLRRESVDLKRAIIEQPRGKTGARHIVPLWPETVRALRDVLDRRAGDELVFRTIQGQPWCRQVPIMVKGKLARVGGHDNTQWRWRELLKVIEKRDRVKMRTKGSGFYKLKHLANTVADAAGDVHATYTLFGHSMGVKGHYVAVSEERVREVVQFMHVHWFGHPKRLLPK